MSSSFAFPAVPPRACCSWRYNSSRIAILIELAVGKTWSAFFRMARSSVRSTIATPVTPSNRSAISSTRACSFSKTNRQSRLQAKTLVPRKRCRLKRLRPRLSLYRSESFSFAIFAHSALTFFEREPRRIEVRERLFQLFQLGRRPVHFKAREIGHLHRLGQKRADVVEMREQAFGVFVGFATKKLIAVPAEFVEEHSLLSRGLGHEARQHRLDRVPFPRMNSEVRVQAHETRLHDFRCSSRSRGCRTFTLRANHLNPAR